MIYRKKNWGHRTSKIVKSRQSSNNGHLPYHLFILWLSARAHGWRGMWVCVRSKDAQKQLARTSLSPGTCFKSTICFQSTQIVYVIRGCWRKILHQKGFRGLCTADFILRALKHWFVIFLSIEVPKKQFLRFGDGNKTLEILHVRFDPQRSVISIVFLTLRLAGHLGCVWGRKSLKNGMETGGIF